MYIVDTARFRAFADEVSRLKDPDDIKIALGEMLDVWPESIFPGLHELREEQEVVAAEINVDCLAATLAEIDRMPEEEYQRLSKRPT